MCGLVPKGFVPYQLSGDSGVFSGLSGSRNKSLTMDEGSGLNTLTTLRNCVLSLF